LQAVIERGMKNGDKIVFTGEGEQDPDCDPGDVIVIVKSTPHQYFQRQGAHLFMKKQISLADALTGFEFKIIHLDDRVLVVNSKAGKVTKPGQLRVIRNEGMPHRHNPFKKGHLYLEFDVEFPESMDIKQVELLRAVFGKKASNVSLPQEPQSAPPGRHPETPAAAGGGEGGGGGGSKNKKKKNKHKKNESASSSSSAGGSSSSSGSSSSASSGSSSSRAGPEGKEMNGPTEEGGPEEVELDDVNVDIEKALWRQEKEEEAERRSQEEDEEDGPRTAQCATH